MKVGLTCPNCGGKNIFMRTEGVSGSGYGNYLPGLGGFGYYAKLYPTICQDCGLVRFFTDEDAVSKLEGSHTWERLAGTPEKRPAAPRDDDGGGAEVMRRDAELYEDPAAGMSLEEFKAAFGR